MSRVEKKIGDHTFYIRRYDAFLSLEILGDLQRRFFAPLLAIMDGAQSGTPEQKTAAFSAGLEKMSVGLDGPTLRDLAAKLLNSEFISVSISGAEPRKLDQVAIAQSLSGAADVIDLCLAVVKANYSDFGQRWPALSGLGGSLLASSQSGGSALN